MESKENIITVKVKLFAIYQEVYKRDEILVQLPSSVTVKELLNYICEGKTVLEKWKEITKFAVNLEFVSEDFEINNQDEIAFIPPVSGG